MQCETNRKNCNHTCPKCNKNHSCHNKAGKPFKWCGDCRYKKRIGLGLRWKEKIKVLLLNICCFSFIHHFNNHRSKTKGEKQRKTTMMTTMTTMMTMRMTPRTTMTMMMTMTTTPRTTTTQYC